MSAYARQLSAAQRQHESSCDCCGPEPDTEQAVADYAEQLVEADEVGELVQELYAAGNTILVALTKRQQATGRAPDFATVTVMQRLRRLIKAVEDAS